MLKVKLKTLCVAAALLVSACAESQSNPKSNSKDSASGNALTMNTETPSNGKAAVKEAAINFFKWHTTEWQNPIWETKPQLRKKRPSMTFVRNRNGKPDQEGNCPCTFDWKAIDVFYSWINKNATIISKNYLTHYRKMIKVNDPKLKKRNSDEYEFQNEITGYIFWFVFAQDYVDFNALGVFDTKSQWSIELLSDSTATATVIYNKAIINEEDNALILQMIKENGSWKLARNVDWAQVDPTTLAIKRRTVL